MIRMTLPRTIPRRPVRALQLQYHSIENRRQVRRTHLSNSNTLRHSHTMRREWFMNSSKFRRSTRARMSIPIRSRTPKMIDWEEMETISGYQTKAPLQPTDTRNHSRNRSNSHLLSTRVTPAHPFKPVVLLSADPTRNPVWH